MNTDVKAIFEQSRTLENLEGAAVLMRSLDKAPSSLRALSDFVTKARKSGNTEQFEEADIGRNNVFAVSPYWLFVEEGLNLRDVNYDRAVMFKHAYLERPQSVPVIRVKPVVVEGVTRLKIIDGHHRFAGLMMAIAEGASFQKITVEEFEGGKDEEVYNMIESANSLQLKMVERAEGFKRLIGWGHTIESIAQRLGVSLVTVRRSIVLANADFSIKMLVKEDKVSGDVAVDVINECQGTDRDPYEVLMESLKKAEGAGKTRVTAKFVSSKKKTGLKPKVIRKTFDSLLPTLSQLRDQIPPQPEGEHENQIEITETVPEEVVLRLTPEMARTLMANHAVLTHMVSFKSQIALIQQEADRGLHRRFTIASNLVSSAGELLIDQLLGDAARDADEPVDILEVVINPAPTGEPGAKLKKNGETFWHKHWCDLCKPGTEESLALSHIHAPDHVITRTSFSSKEDAILFVLKTMPQARKYEKDFFRDNDFDVPDGIIERWIDR